MVWRWGEEQGWSGLWGCGLVMDRPGDSFGAWSKGGVGTRDGYDLGPGGGS